MDRNKKIAGIKKIILTVVLISAAVMASNSGAQGMFREEEAVHILSSYIENSTLIIGTHLIHLSRLNDYIFSIASNSKESSGQYALYYKSELSEGRWFEITDALELSDIVEEGKAVEDSVVEGLFIRYHTKSDGITYDLLTGEPVCIFDIEDCYNLAEMSEMEGIINQYEQLKNKKDKTKTDIRNIGLIEEFLDRDLREETGQQETDNALEGMQDYYESISPEGGDLPDTVLLVMKELDSGRRLAVHTLLNEVLLPELLEKLQKDDGTSEFYVDYNLVEGVGEALEASQLKQIECEASALDEGSTAIAEKKYKAVEEISKYARQGNFVHAGDLLETIDLLTDIEAGTGKNPEKEFYYIKNNLLPELLDNIQEGNFSDDKGSSGIWEIEYLAKYGASLAKKSDAASLLEEVLKRLGEIADSSNVNVSGEEIDSLKKLMEALEKCLEKYISQGEELQMLIAEKEKLKLQRLSALDKNNLGEADGLADKLNNIEKQIAGEKDRLSKILNSSQAGDSEKAAAERALKAESDSNTIIEKRDEIKKDIDDGSYDSALSNLDVLAELTDMNVPLTVASMQELYSGVLTEIYLKDKDFGELNRIKEKLEIIITENSDSLKQINSDNSITGEQALGVIENAAGVSYEEMDGRDKAAAAAAMHEFGMETVNSALINMGEGLLSKLYAQDNPWIFEKLKGETEEYIPLKAFSECCGYRYVFYNMSKRVTVTKDGDYHTYDAFSSVEIINSENKGMDTYARFQSDIYLPEKYMENSYNVSCLYINGIEYGVIISDYMENEITEFTEALMNSTGM